LHSGGSPPAVESGADMPYAKKRFPSFALALAARDCHRYQYLPLPTPSVYLSSFWLDGEQERRMKMTGAPYHRMIHRMGLFGLMLFLAQSIHSQTLIFNSGRKSIL